MLVWDISMESNSSDRLLMIVSRLILWEFWNFVVFYSLLAGCLELAFILVARDQSACLLAVADKLIVIVINTSSSTSLLWLNRFREIILCNFSLVIVVMLFLIRLIFLIWSWKLCILLTSLRFFLLLLHYSLILLLTLVYMVHLFSKSLCCYFFGLYSNFILIKCFLIYYF